MALVPLRQFSSSPDVAVLDIAMPGLRRLGVLAGVIAGGLSTKIVFLTALATDDLLAAIANGAWAALKDAAFDSLVDCH
jgi:CheY-like chemotaxis protein